MKLGQARQRKRDYSVTFESPEGKRVLHDLIASHSVLTPTKGSEDEGARNAVLRILSILKYSPQDFVDVTEELEIYERRDVGQRNTTGDDTDRYADSYFNGV